MAISGPREFERAINVKDEKCLIYKDWLILQQIVISIQTI